MRISDIALVAGFIASFVPSLGAQSLADAARQEEERRKSVKASGKVFTNKDLKLVPQSEPASADATAPVVPVSTSAPDTGKASASPGSKLAAKDAAGGKKADPTRQEKDEAYWHGRMQVLRERLDQDKTLAEALQSRVNALTADFVNRDDPAQRAVIEIDRQKALAELERMKKAVTASTNAVAELEEEARLAGVPPGWLR